MSFGRTKVDPLEVGEPLSIPECIGELRSVNPMDFKRTKVDSLKVGKLLPILQGIGELRSIL